MPPKPTKGQIDLERLDLAMERVGIETATELAKRLGIARSQITKWRLGMAPNADVLRRLSAILRVSQEYLLGEPEPPAARVLALHGYHAEAKLLADLAHLGDKERDLVLAYVKGLIDAKGPAQPSGGAHSSVPKPFSEWPGGNTIWRDQ